MNEQTMIKFECQCNFLWSRSVKLGNVKTFLYDMNKKKSFLKNFYKEVN